MAVKYANSAAIAAADAVTALVNGGDLRLRTGAAPANADDAATGTLLATFTLPNPAFAGAVDGTPGADAVANAISNTTGAAAGDVGYYEVRDSGGTVRWTGSATVTGGGGDLELNIIAIQVGQTVQVTSWTHSHRET